MNEILTVKSQIKIGSRTGLEILSDPQHKEGAVFDAIRS